MNITKMECKFSTCFPHEQTFFCKTEGYPLNFELNTIFFKNLKKIIYTTVMSSRCRI
jgi:hypothetical protein